MGIFSGSKKGLSKKPVEEWNQEQVLRWLAYLGKEKYADKFKAVKGKRLLQLTAADLYQLVDTKLEADFLLDSIVELRVREGMQQLQAPAAATAGGSGPSISAHFSALPPVKTGVNGIGKHASSRASTGSRTPASTPPALATRPHHFYPEYAVHPFNSLVSPDVLIPIFIGKKGAAENAEVLSNLVGGNDIVNDLFAYMSFLGIQGMGLVEATERSPVVGHIIGALWEVHDLVANAKGNRGNCLQLDAYGQDILRVFDAEGNTHCKIPPMTNKDISRLLMACVCGAEALVSFAGKRLAFISNDALSRVLQLIEQGIAVVENCCRPGWLLRMANAERSIEEFQAVHNGILEKLRAEKVDTLPNGRQLTYGEYHDASRPLRRCLKQLGSGSLEQGMAAALQQESALMEVSQLIGIDSQAILKDLRHISGQPELDVLSTQEQSHTSSVSCEYSPMSPISSAGGEMCISFDNHEVRPLQVAGRSKEYQTIFTQYDKNQSGALEFEELRSVLADLGLLDGIKPTEIEGYTLQQFILADADEDNRVDYDEFVNFYQSLSTTKARRELRSALGPQAEKDLKKIFHSFASFGVRQNVEEMDGAKFSKLCRDCKLLSRSFTTIDVDLIFAKTKVKGQRRINFDGFLSALAKVADKKTQILEDVVRQILSAGGPTVTGTRAEYVKFHDDKSTYTGVYSRGGPTNVEPSRELSSLLDRSEADVRGVKKRLSSASGDAPLSARGTPPSRASHGGMSEPALTARGRRESSTSGHADHRPKSVSLTGEPSGFGLGASRLAATSLPPAAPRSNGSGTPKSVEGSQLGTVTAAESAPYAATLPNGTAVTPTSVSLKAPNDGSLCAPDFIKRLSKDSGTSPSKGTPKVPKLAIKSVTKEELLGVFNAFASFGNRGASAASNGSAELDGAKFAKLCRESQLLDSSFTSTSADIIFSRVRGKGARKIGFKDFEKALEAIAAEKNTSVDDIQTQIVGSGGPKRTGTTPTSHIRLHDDKSNYTGVYKAGGPSVIDKHITLQSLTDRTNTPSNQQRMSL